MNRRDLCKTAAWTALSASRVLGANDRVGIGLIGCGIEGTEVAGLMKRKGAEVIVPAVCDVYAPNAERARAQLGATETYKDFRRLLERRDIDAVVVATPDHWHAIPTVLACEAGKDVYVEKPLSHTLAEGRKMVRAAKRFNRIVCMGSQQRSAPHVIEAARIVQSGELGTVDVVRAWDCYNAFPASGTRSRTEGNSAAARETPPADLDWDFWLGPAPAISFTESRWRGWRSFLDYGGGTIGDLGTHWLDSVMHVMDLKAPVAVSAASVGRTPVPTMHLARTVVVTYEFPSAVVAYEVIGSNGRGNSWRSPGREYFYPKGSEDIPHGILFYGSNATMFLDRYSFEVFPEPGDPVSAPPRMGPRQAFEREPKVLHAKHFIECIRNRTKPSADVETAHQSTTLPHLGLVATLCGRKLRWDAAREICTDDPEATGLLQRADRKPYDLI